MKRTSCAVFVQLVALQACLVPGFSQNNGAHLVGHLNKPHGFSSAGTQFSACWGWVSPQGKEYALISADSGTSIIDLNTDSLREVQFVPGPQSHYIWREIKTYKQYAYIVAEAGGGVQIVDLSGLPESVKVVKNFIYVDQQDSGRSNTRSHTVTIADGYLYCNGSATWQPGGALIFSLRNDPVNPQLEGRYEPEYLHDTYVRNDTFYGAAIGTGGGLYVAGVADKGNPVLLGKISYSGSGTHNAWASIDGKYAFTTDEVGLTTHNMKVWALDSLPRSVKVAEYAAEPSSVAHNVHGRGHYAYVSHYTAGMRVVDVHDPRNPVEAGYYDTYPGPSGGYDGCWGVFPYFPSGRWIGSDMQTGLYVCTFDGLKPRVRSRLLSPANNASVEGPAIQFRWTSAADQAEDPHTYQLHVYGGTLDTLLDTPDTAFTMAAAIPGGTYSWDVLIRDEYTEVSSQDSFHFALSPSGVEGKFLPPVPFSLRQNFPNPFNPLTKIEFVLPRATDVTLTVIDLLGRVVRTLLKNRQLAGGLHEVVFDGSHLPSGFYFYRLLTPGYAETRKMVLGR